MRVLTARVPATLLLALALGASACTSSAPRYQRAELAARAPAEVDHQSLLIGEFGFDGPSAVLDGDTVKVQGLKSSMRLLGIDTEETFKKDAERQLHASLGFDAYMRELRGDSPRPVKAATGMGEEAKRWAQDFFRGVTRLRLERDHPKEVLDFYGRYLAYIFVERDGTWVNYNVECVRAGMSPYFEKYGRSRRFHQEFVAAQEEARAAGRGIWDPATEHYPDYDERLVWWTARGAQVEAFEQAAEASPEHYVAITRHDAMERLAAKMGDEVVILGQVGKVIRRTRGPSVMVLSRTRVEQIQILFWRPELFDAVNPEQYVGEYIQVHGRASRYTDRRGRESLQLVVDSPVQVAKPGTAVALGSLPANGRPAGSPATPLVRPAAAAGGFELEAPGDEAIAPAGAGSSSPKPEVGPLDFGQGELPLPDEDE